MTDQTSKAIGFLGRGPMFWIGLTFGTMGAIVGLVVSGAVEGKATAFILMSVPLACMAGVFLAMLKKNEVGASECVNRGEAQRRYIKRVAVFTSLYLASFAALTFVDQLGDLPEAVRLAIGALPGLAVVGFFWSIGRLIVEESDEFMRMLTVRQTLIASGLAMSAASIWGMLESADMVPHVDAYWYAVIWFGGLVLGSVVNRITYGAWGAA
ncbi:MAG: hypothetical protein AAGH57_12860 [Pseudomonadota bacterium]